MVFLFENACHIFFLLFQLLRSWDKCVYERDTIFLLKKINVKNCLDWFMVDTQFIFLFFFWIKHKSFIASVYQKKKSVENLEFSFSEH